VQGGCEFEGLCVEVDDAQSGDQSVGLESDLDGKGEVREHCKGQRKGSAWPKNRAVRFPKLTKSQVEREITELRVR
jgi:hypothetical protein